MEGILDWYLVGVAAGFGVAVGLSTVWLSRADGGRPIAVAVLGAMVAVCVVVAVFVVVWAAVAHVGGVAVALWSFRKLSSPAMPAAVIGSSLLALVPVLGYVEAVSSPVVGMRLERRAATRHAGLRILAKD